MGKWPSGHDQLTSIRLTGGYGGKTIPAAAQFEYDRHGFEGYLGNVSQTKMSRILHYETGSDVPNLLMTDS